LWGVKEKKNIERGIRLYKGGRRKKGNMRAYRTRLQGHGRKGEEEKEFGISKRNLTQKKQ